MTCVPLLQAFRDCLTDVRLTEAKILNVNERKGQVSATVRKDLTGSHYVLKFATNPKTIEPERLFYAQHAPKYNFVPKLIGSANNYLIFEYYQGQTLREFLSANRRSKERAEVLRSVSEVLEQLYGGNAIYIDESVRASLCDRLNALFTSRQAGGKRTRVETFVSKVVFRLVVPIFRQIIKDAGQPNPQIIHGDLHLNNILVLGDRSIKVIDWEKWGRGSSATDLLFLLPMINKKLRGARALSRFWGARYLDKNMQFIAKVMLFAALSNRAI